MQVIYAKGRPGHLDFYSSNERASVPDGAIIFAICTGAKTIENTDEDLFDAITDQEYFTMKQMVYEATQNEAREGRKRRQTTQSTLEISVNRFFRWLTSAPTVVDVPSLQKHPSNC